MQFVGALALTFLAVMLIIYFLLGGVYEATMREFFLTHPALSFILGWFVIAAIFVWPSISANNN